MLSRLVISFLPRSKHLLISWLQSPSAVILEPPQNYIYRERERERERGEIRGDLFWELVHMIMEAQKYQDLLSASW